MSKGMTKESILESLRTKWKTMDPGVKKELIQSLIGHRMKFSQIADKICRTTKEISNAWKGIVITSEPVVSTAVEFPDSCGNAGGVVNPKVLEVAPMKAMYNILSFDEILQKYREFIGWSDHLSSGEVGQGPSDPEYLEGIIISDIHAPFHDEEKLAKVINQTRGKVDICVLAGDGPDFHNYSKYMKYGQHFSMRDEHKSFTAVLAMLSESYPEIVMIPGNHDERTRKKFAQTLPADLYQSLLDFHGSNAFDFAELMTRQFDNIIIPKTPANGFAEYRFLYQINDIVIGHPELFSKIANRPVANFIDWLMKKALPMGLVNPFSAVVMGHTHQAGKTFNDYNIVGIENGCLCMTPDYDSGAKLSGAPRPVVHGYTRFRTNKLTGKTDNNDINFIRV